MENRISFADHHIPPEIVSEICSYVPLKTLGRLRCLSKDCGNLLTSYTFAKTHLAHTADSPPNLLLLGSHSIFRVTALDTNKLYGNVMKFNSHLYQIGGSCDGLVLVVGESYGKFLINPFTSEMLKLPESPFCLDPAWCYCLHGFGYDTATDDYKVVTISYFGSECPEEYPDHVPYIDIFSVKSNSWTRKGISPYTHDDESWSSKSSGVFLRGNLHWLVSDSDSTFISAFNLVSENFVEEISGPNSLDSDTLKTCKMMLINGCIGIIDDLSGDNMHIDRTKVNMFILKIYGSAESWTKVVVDLTGASWKKAVCIWNDWLFLSVKADQENHHDVKADQENHHDVKAKQEDHHDLVGYSLNDGGWGYRNVHVDANGARDCCDDRIKNEQFFDGVMFSESILSPQLLQHLR